MSGLFSKPKVPDPPKPVLMPDPEDPAKKEDERLRYLAARQRGGRASTMLSGDDNYSGTTTGMR